MAFNDEFKTRSITNLTERLHQQINTNTVTPLTPIHPTITFDESDNLVINFTTPCQRLPYFNPLQFIECDVFNITECDILSYSFNRKTDHIVDEYFLIIELD